MHHTGIEPVLQVWKTRLLTSTTMMLGANDGTWTHTTFRSIHFKCTASPRSATSALCKRSKIFAGMGIEPTTLWLWASLSTSDIPCCKLIPFLRLLCSNNRQPCHFMWLCLSIVRSLQEAWGEYLSLNGARETRTLDILNANQTLFHLSYNPIICKEQSRL